MILVTLPFSYVPDTVVFRKSLEEKATRLIESHRKVLSFLLDNPDSTLSDAASACSLSLGGVKKIVQSLKKDGLIKREGDRRKGKWIR